MKNLRNSVVIFFLVLLTLITYRQVGRADFVYYDDQNYVTLNPHVQAGLTLEGISWAFTTFSNFNWHPITWLSYMLDFHLFGLNPAGFHWTNLVLHMANVLLLFLIFQYMTNAFWPSAFIAALFALHPLHVESVAWISERKDLLSAFFMFLTLGAYTRYVRSEKKLKSWTLVILLFALGLMSKPMLVTLPFILLLLDVWPLERLKKGEASVSALIIEKIPLLILSLISSALTLLAQYKGGALGTLETFPMMTRLANTAVSYGAYLTKMFYPTSLAVYYPQTLIAPWQWISAALLLVTLTVITIILSRKRPYLWVGWAWYLVMLIPVIGIVQVGTQAMADRYTYLPLIGLFIMTTWGVNDLLSSWVDRKMISKTILITLSTLTLFALLVVSRSQVVHWKNSETLFGHALHVTENNYKVHIHLGTYWASQKKFDKATEEYIQAIQVGPEPNTVVWFNNFGNNLAASGGLEDAVACYSAILHVKPDSAPAHFNLGKTLEKMGRNEEAVEHYKSVLQIMPGHEPTQKRLKALEDHG